MEHTTPPLTTVQHCVVNALAAGSTLTDAAAQYVLARRDDLHQLSNRALETLLAILDNPKPLPAVLLRTPETPAETETPSESATSEPPPPAESPATPLANVTGCNPMQHNSRNCDDIAPPAVQKAPADAEADEEEIPID